MDREKNNEIIKEENLYGEYNHDYKEVIEEVIKDLNKKNKRKNRVVFSIAAGTFAFAFATGFLANDYINGRMNNETKNVKYEQGLNNNNDDNNLLEDNKEEEKNDENENKVEKENLTVEEVAKKVSPAVVTINVSTEGTRFSQGKQGVGTGFIVDKDGTVVTNYHVIEGASTIIISFNDGREVTGRVVGTSQKDDLAILDITEEIEMPGIVELAEGNEINAGQEVVAIGNPLGKEFSGTVTRGIVSSPKRMVNIDGISREFIQTDAAINPGNSGGPLINLKGEIIGVNSAKQSGENIEGIGFAVPIKYVREMLNNLDNYKNEDNSNNYNNDNSENYFGGYPESGYGQGYGDESYGYNNPFGYEDGVESYDGYNENKRGKLGIMVASTEEGVIVTKVEEGSVAEKAGIEVNDVIVKFNGVKITSAQDIILELSNVKSNEWVEVIVNRNNQGTSLIAKF